VIKLMQVTRLTDRLLHKPVDDVLACWAPRMKHAVDWTTRSRDIVIRNSKNAKFYDVITDVIRSESTPIREDYLDIPHKRTCVKISPCPTGTAGEQAFRKTGQTERQNDKTTDRLVD